MLSYHVLHTDVSCIRFMFNNVVVLSVCVRATATVATKYFNTYQFSSLKIKENVLEFFNEI